MKKHRFLKHHESICNKHPYETSKIAKRELKKFMKKRCELKANYYCEGCDAWHLTKKPREYVINTRNRIINLRKKLK